MTCTTVRHIWISFVAIAMLVMPAAATTIDDLQLSQSVATNGTASSEVTPGAGEVVLGGARDLAVATDGAAVTATVAAGELSFTAPAGSTGSVVGVWDGVDAAAEVLDPAGLGGIDLTDSGSHDALWIPVVSASAVRLTVEVYSDAGNWSASSMMLADTASLVNYVLPYAQFVAGGGAGADFQDVGAVVLRLEGTGAQATLGPVATAEAGPQLQVTQRDLDATALGGGGGAELGSNPRSPGASYTLSMTITNTGDEAVGVSVDQLLDSDVSVVGSFRSTPIVRRDIYTSCGNVTLRADGSVASGVIEGAGNDYDPDGQALSVTSLQTTSDEGGTVTLDDAATGRFEYVPPPGFTGIDRFTYTVQDPDGNQATGEVQVSVAGLVWFVDSASGGSNEGTEANPFTSLSSLGGSDPDEPGDAIVIHAGSGTYAGGLVLEDDQQLYGSSSSVLPCSLAPTGSRPVIGNVGGVGLTLASGNTVDELDVDGALGAGVSGTSVGSLSISNVSVRNADGAAVDIVNGSLDATFDSLESVGTVTNQRGVNLDGVSGTFAVTGSTTIQDADGAGIRVANSGGATIGFGATTISDTAAGGAQATGVDLATGNAGASFSFASLSVATDGGAGIVAAGSGSVSLGGDPRAVVASGGPALDLASTTVSGFTFATLSSAGSGSNGLRLQNVTGAVTGNGGSMAGSSGTAVTISGGFDAVTYAGSISSPSTTAVSVTGRTGGAVTVAGTISHTASAVGIDVASNSGGTTTFSGASKAVSSGAFTAVRLANNTGHLVSFTGGGLALQTTGSQTAFSVTGGGTVAVTGGANTIGATTPLSGPAVGISDTTIGASGVTFERISVTGGSVPAIVLDDTGAGLFQVTGVGSTAGSGGTIQDLLVSDAITLNNTDGLVSLRNMVIEDIGSTAGGFNTRSQHDAVHGQQVDGGLRLENVTIRRISDNAVNGALFSDGVSATSWTGLEIIDSTFEDTNRFHVAGVGDDSDEGTVRIVGISGTVSVEGSTFRRGAEHLDLFTATSGSLDMTVVSSVFENAYKEFSSGVVSSVGKICADVTVEGSANATVTVGDELNALLGNSFLNCHIASVRIGNNTGASGDIDAIIARNEFLVTDHSSGVGGDFDFPQGGVKLSSRGTDAASVDGIISNNSFEDVANADGGVGQVTLDMEDGDWQVRVDNNSFIRPGNAPWYVRADSTASAALLWQNNTYVRGPFPCTVDPSCAGGYFGPGLRSLVQVRNGGVLDIRLDQEDFAQHDVGYDPGNTMEVQVQSTGGGGNACVHLTNSSSPHGYALEQYAGVLDLQRGVSAASGSCTAGSPGSCITVVGDNGNTGGGGNPATVPPDVSVFGTVTITPSACAQPAGGIF